MAQHPSELACNLPGVAPAPAAADGSVQLRLPALIKTQFEHPQYGNVTAIAILWYMDRPRDTRVKPSARGHGFEHFFVHTDEQAQDAEYPTSFPSDTHPEYTKYAPDERSHSVAKGGTNGNNDDNDGCDELSFSHNGPQQTFNIHQRRVRVLCLHEIIAVYPVGIPLMHTAVGRFFSSFNASLDHLQSVHAGWQGWHLLHDPAVTVSHAMSAAGFINPPVFGSTRVREQLTQRDSDEDTLRIRAQHAVEDDYDAASCAAGRNTKDWPFDAASHTDAIAARMQCIRQQAEAKLDPTEWCLRDALACLCIHMHPRLEIERGGECNAVTCLLANSPQNRPVQRQPETGREIYLCRRNQTHSYMAGHVRAEQLKAERKRAKQANCLPRAPLEMLRAAGNTVELQRLMQGELTATETHISFLDMPSDDWDVLRTSLEWFKSALGRSVMEDMRRRIPLYRFFALSACMLGTLQDVLTCVKYSPKHAKSFRYKNCPLVQMTFVRHHTFTAKSCTTKLQSTFLLTMPEATFQQVMQHDKRLRATEGRSLTGDVNPRWIVTPSVAQLTQATACALMA
jgi:hypothetical protein